MKRKIRNKLIYYLYVYYFVITYWLFLSYFILIAVLHFFKINFPQCMAHLFFLFLGLQMGSQLFLFFYNNLNNDHNKFP